MNKKYTVIVRIKVNKSKKSVVGCSSYDNKSYNHKFKSAVLNAVYIDYSNKHKKFASGSDFNYTLVNHNIAYLNKPKKHARKGVNLRIHQQIIQENKKRIEEKEKDKYQSKKSIKDMYKKEPKQIKKDKMKPKTYILTEKQFKEYKELKKKEKLSKNK